MFRRLLTGRSLSIAGTVGFRPKLLLEVTSPIGMMATAHVCWVKEGDIRQKGFIALPERPGIGVEMNDDAARKAQVTGTPWFGSRRRE